VHAPCDLSLVSFAPFVSLFPRSNSNSKIKYWQPYSPIDRLDTHLHTIIIPLLPICRRPVFFSFWHPCYWCVFNSVWSPISSDQLRICRSDYQLRRILYRFTCPLVLTRWRGHDLLGPRGYSIPCASFRPNPDIKLIAHFCFPSCPAEGKQRRSVYKCLIIVLIWSRFIDGVIEANAGGTDLHPASPFISSTLRSMEPHRSLRVPCLCLISSNDSQHPLGLCQWRVSGSGLASFRTIPQLFRNKL